MLPERDASQPEQALKLRLFFALWPPAESAARLGGYAREAADLLGGRATRAETVHLTLAFLGQVAESRVPALIDIAGGVCAPAFTLTFDKVDYWARQRLLWAGCAESPALRQLAGRLQSELGAAGFAVDGASRPFIPHVTLLRSLPHPPATPARPVLPPETWPVGEFVLVHSVPDAQGANYRELARFPLK